MNDVQNVCVNDECCLFLWKHLCLLKVRMLLAKGIDACLQDGNKHWAVVEEVP